MIIYVKKRFATKYKGKGDNDNSSNYRPISTLPSIAKVLESSVHTKTVDQLSKY